MPPTLTQHAGLPLSPSTPTSQEFKSQDAMQPTESAQRRASSTAATAPRRSMGCMAGLLRLLSPYHRHRKRLTAKNATLEASLPPPSPPPMKKPGASPSPTQAPEKPHTPTAVRRRRSCEAPRSPTIAPEYRRASCDSPRPPPPAIVARLMGLEESVPASPATTPRPRPLPTRPPPPPPPEMAAEKRRKLLGALEKCDDDLQTLRRIIAAVRAAELRSAAASDVSPAPAGEGKWMDGSPPLQRKPWAVAQYPSPDSVLDAITSPRFPCRKRSSPCTHLDADSNPEITRSTIVRSKMVKPSRTLVFSGDYCKMKQYCNELHAMAMYHHPATVAAVEGMPRWPPSAAEAMGWQHRRVWGLEGSRAMVESVGEVWGQGAGEGRWEAGLVGAALERAIMQELVLDVVTELLAAHSEGPFGQFGHGHHHGGGAMCRKRLCF